MSDPPVVPPGHWVQCPECREFFENEQGRGSHRLHNHGVRGAPNSKHERLVVGAALPDTSEGPPAFTPPTNAVDEVQTREQNHAELPAPRIQANPGPPAPKPLPSLAQADMAPVTQAASTPAPPPSGPRQTTLPSADDSPHAGRVVQTQLDWSDPKNLPTGFAALSQTLAHTPPNPNLGKVGRFVCFIVVMGLAGLALYFVVRELKGTNAPKPSYAIDEAPNRPGARQWTTGDPYWVSLLGYRRPPP